MLKELNERQRRMIMKPLRETIRIAFLFILLPLLASLSLFSLPVEASEKLKVAYEMKYNRSAIPPRWEVQVNITSLDPKKGPVQMLLTDWGEWSREPQ